MTKHLVYYTLYLFMFNAFAINESASVFDYLPTFANSWFETSDKRSENAELQAMQKVPYEVAVVDEKFIEQAAKYTGVALSELDKCQHRVRIFFKVMCSKITKT